METRAFGNSGLSVPAIGMGTWRTFDVRGAAAEQERQAVADAAIAAGATLFDTSPMYGESERVLAAAVARRRSEVLIADKVWTSSRDEGQAQIRRALEWYGGVVEVYQIHNLLAWREHLPMLEDLRERGAVRVIGATHYQHSAFAELMEVMHTGRVGMVQVPYNAADRGVEREVLPLAEQRRLGVMVMRPLGAGELVRHPPSQRALARLESYGVTTWAQVLLKWVLSDPRVHCAIPATSRIERAGENAVAGVPPWFDDEAREYVSALAARR